MKRLVSYAEFERREEMPRDEAHFPFPVIIRFVTEEDRRKFLGGLFDGWGEGDHGIHPVADGDTYFALDADTLHDDPHEDDPDDDEETT